MSRRQMLQLVGGVLLARVLPTFPGTTRAASALSHGDVKNTIELIYEAANAVQKVGEAMRSLRCFSSTGLLRLNTNAAGNNSQ